MALVYIPSDEQKKSRVGKKNIYSDGWYKVFSLMELCAFVASYHDVI